MSEIDDIFFGPLSKNWCLYFYFLSILWFFFFLVSIIYLISFLFSKKANSNIVFGMLIYSLTLLVLYFEKRILHGMCINASK